jgi:hypothetical protein
VKIKRSSEQILIRHVPLLSWIAGGATLITIVVLSAWFTIDKNVVNLLLSVCIMLGFILVTYYSFFDFRLKSGIFAVRTWLLIDRSKRFIEITRTRIYGRTISRHYFYQADRFRSYKVNRLGTKQYFLSLKLPNRRSIRLKIPLGSDKNETVKLIKELNNFMGKNRK